MQKWQKHDVYSFNLNVVFLLFLKVAPAELEALINTHPSVQDAAVVGLKMGEDVGEVPKAFVVLKPDANIKPLEIQEFVESKLSVVHIKIYINK